MTFFITFFNKRSAYTKFILSLVVTGIFVLVFWLGTTHRAPRVILVGFDGLDNIHLAKLITEGRLPNFKKIRDEGAWGDLKTIEPILSPIVWTSIETGRSPEDHGVFHFFEEDKSGTLRPVSSLGRRVPALWNIAAHYGVRPGFIGWYASWPAEEVGDGFIISNQISAALASAPESPLGLTYPPVLESEVADMFPADDPLKKAMGRFINMPLDDVSMGGKAAAHEFYLMYNSVEFTRRAAFILTDRFRPELLGLYFKFPDVVEHFFADYSPPAIHGSPSPDIVAFEDAVDRCYEYLDEILGDIMTLMGDETTLIICSDHGFRSGENKPPFSSSVHTLYPVFWHRKNGSVILYGHGIGPGTKLTRASIYDIAPTVLHLLDLPLSQELEGTVLWDALNGAVGTKFDVHEVPSYSDVPTPKVKIEGEMDIQAMRQELQALGYLGAGEGILSKGTPRDHAMIYSNHALIKLQNNKTNEAYTLFETAAGIDSEFELAPLYMGIIDQRRDRLDSAVTHLRRALDLKPDSPMAMTALGDIYYRKGMKEEANILFERFHQIPSSLPDAHYRAALYFFQTASYQKTLEALTRGLKFTDAPDLEAKFHNLAGITLGELKDYEKAETAFLHVLSVMPTYNRAHMNLGMLYNRMGRFDKAWQELKTFERIQPGSLYLLNELGRASLGKGDKTAAIAYFEKSISQYAQQPEIAELLAKARR